MRGEGVWGKQLIFLGLFEVPSDAHIWNMRKRMETVAKSKISCVSDIPRRSSIDQFRCIKIQPNTIYLSTRLWGINPTNFVVVPESLVLRSIVLR